MEAAFNGKVALVTGGGSGIGQAAAIEFARQGAKVGVLNRSEAAETLQKIKEIGGTAIEMRADVTDEKTMEQEITRLVNQWGRLDVLFVNAGINGVWAPLENMTSDEWRKTFDVNVQGAFHTIKYAAPYLKKQGGAIVINSSVNGTRIFSNAGATCYACTKAALVAMTKMLALEFADAKVRVNAVCPGWIETNIDDNTEKRDIEQIEEPVDFLEGRIPLTDGGPGSSQQVADVVAFLCSSAASHVTGSIIYVDGGESLLQG